MKMMKINVYPHLLIVILFLISCGENVDPTKADVQVEMKAVTQLSAINTGARVANSGIEFTEVLVGVTEIEFESMESDDSNDDSNDDDDNSGSGSGDDDDRNDEMDDDEEIEYEGQFVVDLLKGTSNPDFGVVDVFPGVYEEVEIEISPILDDGISVFIAFTYQPAEGEPVDVEFSSTGKFEIEIENDNGINLDGNSLNQLLILMDLDMLISDLDVSMLEPDEEDGVIRINDSSNSDIKVKIENKIDDSFDAGEDNDDDDEFDDHDSNSDDSNDD